MLRLVRDAIAEQRALARDLLDSPKTRAPTLTVCLAAFGSSLHEAVVPYFYLRVGATTEDIGLLSSLMLGVGLVIDPLLGIWMDRRGSVAIMVLSSFACAFGCFLRGLATSVPQLVRAAVVLGFGGGALELVVLCYLGAVLERGRRSALLAGLSVQTVSLRVLAKAVYPPFAWVLAQLLPGLTLLQYRISLGVCWFFCAFLLGFF